MPATKAKLSANRQPCPLPVLVNLWLQLGGLFKHNNHVILGISNEPHDQSIEKWAVTVQKWCCPENEYYIQYLADTGTSTLITLVSTECVDSHADEVVSVAKMLKADGRQVLLGETGGEAHKSCMTYLPELVKAVVEAYPVFIDIRAVTTVKDESSPTGWKDQGNWLSIKQFLPIKAHAGPQSEADQQRCEKARKEVAHLELKFGRW
ncbi:hypothetical protein Pst134EB_027513 [Puccinia striiformis f. sp. tritici]|nr:hypothetical protein Pst134EB_027513 [Puccinia striiformis f. sp. tritici]